MRQALKLLRKPLHKAFLLLFGSLREEFLSNAAISPRAKLYPPYSIYNTKLGDYSYIAEGAKVHSAEIGKFCSIGPNFLCAYGVHPTNGISTSPMFYSRRKQNGYSLCDKDLAIENIPVKIGNDVLIGANVTVLDGVSIGDGAVIGAGAVVVKDIPPYAVAAGVPAKVLKSRFPQETADALLRIRWWDFPEERLKEVSKHFHDVDKFIEVCLKDLPSAK